MQTFRVKVGPLGTMPKKGSAEAAGFDLCAAKKVSLLPGSTVVVGTDIYVEGVPGYEVQIRSRSGLAAKEGLMVLNSPGTIDSDYNGEILVILHNTNRTARMIHAGDRIAQMVMKEVPMVELVQTEEDLRETVRNAGGLGSTGK